MPRRSICATLLVSSIPGQAHGQEVEIRAAGVTDWHRAKRGSFVTLQMRIDGTPISTENPRRSLSWPFVNLPATTTMPPLRLCRYKLRGADGGRSIGSAHAVRTNASAPQPAQALSHAALLRPAAAFAPLAGRSAARLPARPFPQ